MAEANAEEAFLAAQETEEPAATSADASAQEVVKSSPKQSRTIGGFLVDDEDDDENDDDNDEEVEIDKDENKANAGSQSQKNDEVANGQASNVADESSSTPERHESKSAAAFPHSLDPSTQTDLESAAEPPVPAADADRVPQTVVSASSEPLTSEQLTTTSQSQPSAAATRIAMSSDVPSSISSQTRLPSDRVGILEDRIAEDPRGDLDAWQSLISEHKRRNKVDDVRKTYDRFLALFPTAGEQWVAYVEWELENENFQTAESLFARCLMEVRYLGLWIAYLNYVRRRNSLTQDPDGKKRATVDQTYQFVLDNVGIDKDAGGIWRDYIDFLRSGPGVIGGNGWQDQQKMDLLRKTYHRVILIPLENIGVLWKEYNEFEQGLNKITARKFLQEKSPGFVSARSAFANAQTITKDLVRTTLPRLPPAMGYDGDVEFAQQIELWKSWIGWEKDDPLVLKEDDMAAYKARVIHAYHQALMALRFWPPMWYDAAEYCFANGLEEQGSKYLEDGAKANPESCLLAFRLGDRTEMTTTAESGDENAVKERGEKVRKPYNDVLDANYALINKTVRQEQQAISDAKARHASAQAEMDEDGDENHQASVSSTLETEIEAIKSGYQAHIHLLSKTITFAWIALMRAMRRVQGQGKVGEAIGGQRQIFMDARKAGRVQSDVYVAHALIEYHCYKDTGISLKLFERGLKLYPVDEQFALAYLKHLVRINDVANARAVFAKCVDALTRRNMSQKAKPIYAYFHDFEVKYGELRQIQKLEEDMRKLYPTDPQLANFAQRFAVPEFDPTAARPMISPTQVRPRVAMVPTVQPQLSQQDSPHPSLAQPTIGISNSPKRPLEDSDTESLHPRKIARSDSPLKGAAGRRLEAAKRTPLVQANGPSSLPPQPQLPSMINWWLQVLPRPSTWNGALFIPEKVVEVIRSVDLSKVDPTRLHQSAIRPPMPPMPSMPQAPPPQLIPGYPQYNYGATVPGNATQMSTVKPYLQRPGQPPFGR